MLMSAVLTGMFFLPVFASESEPYRELKTESGLTVYVMEPEAESERAVGNRADSETDSGSSFSEAEDSETSDTGAAGGGTVYPAIYLMPQDGYSARSYLEVDLAEACLEAMETGEMSPAYIILCQFEEGREDELYVQMDEILETVETAFATGTDPTMRCAAGEGVGGYLALLLELTSDDGAVSETPARIASGVSFDGDFASEDNPYLPVCGDLYSLLEVETQGAVIGDWAANYHTQIHSDSDADLTYEEGGSNDIAWLFRADNLMNPTSTAAWDYEVFRYTSKMEEHIAAFPDRLKAVLTEVLALMTEETGSDGDGACGESPDDTEGNGMSAETADGAQADSSEADSPKAGEPQTETEMITQGEDRCIDLSGLWHFATADFIRESADEDADPNSADYIFHQSDYASWEEVQPGLDWWTEDFAECLNGNPYYVGYAWYVKEFEIPEDFDLSDLVYHGGMIDEADECYINGIRIGETGIPEEGGAYDRTNPWDEERSYDIPDGLLEPGKNVIAVRMCNGSGGGGWYAGPIEITAKKSEEETEEENPRFYETEFYSEALDKEATYRVYLPEGYYESEENYPVVYMLHGIGSTGKSFQIAGVPQLLDEGIAAGEIPPCIVIFPDDMHPQKMSWWKDSYADYVNEDLVNEIDESLRTIADRDHRFIAGESMGGGGAWLNAWNHPELYGGIFDIYGAVNYVGVLDELLSDERTKEDFDPFRIYMIAGNHDMYEFDLVHMELAEKLHELGAECRFEIADGEHDSKFYLQYIREGFAYLLAGCRG